MKFKSQEELPVTGNGAKNFLKLKDKESVQGIFRGDVHEFYVLWEGQRSRVVPEGTPGAKFRFRINFVMKEGASYVPKIFEQGLTVYNQLAELHNEYELDKTVVKLTRNGTGTDTTYSTLPLLKTPLTKETMKFLDSMELLPLETETAPAPEQKTDSDEMNF